ncbi:hypothetical protein BH11PLA2_BH11PLA2_06040 [soil metagenome]
MIAASPNLTPTRQRRSAFTLLEVLVVVAILVVLASVASIAVFKFLEDSYTDKAIMDMQTLEKAYKTACLRNPGMIDQNNFNMEMLVPYVEQGHAALKDPWGKTYSGQIIQRENGDDQLIISTTDKKGNPIQWPRQ